MTHAAHGTGSGVAAIVVLFVLVPFALCVAYVLAASRDRHWSSWRTASFTLGTALVAAAMLPTVADRARDDLLSHMAQHLVLGMYAPIVLVLGAPMTLLLRSLPAAGGRRLVYFLDTRPVRVLVHPVTAALLDVGGMWVLYLTPLYVASLDEPVVHVLVHVHFVISGYLFTWAMIGPDPAPRRPGFPARLVVLGLAMAAHAILAKLMYGYGFPRVPDGAAEIESAAMLMYYGGDVAEIVIAVPLFAAWFRHHRSASPPPPAAGWLTQE